MKILRIFCIVCLFFLIVNQDIKLMKFSPNSEPETEEEDYLSFEENEGEE